MQALHPSPTMSCNFKEINDPKAELIISIIGQKEVCHLTPCFQETRGNADANPYQLISG